MQHSKRNIRNEVDGESILTHPGYLGSQDTLYASTFKKTSGGFYQQTFVDTYFTVAFAKQHTTPIMATDFTEEQLLMLRILTDPGTTYYWRAEAHDYQQYLAIDDIEHSKPKVISP